MKNMIDYLLFGVYFFTVVFLMRVAYRWTFSGKVEAFKSAVLRFLKNKEDKKMKKEDKK